MLVGLLAGVLLATLIGYLLAKSRLLERLLSPYLVASQAIPIVAIAPLLVIWFGPGIFSKILICALIVFFPVLVNTVVGMRAVPEHLRDLMRSMHATPLQMARYLEIPAALPVFLGGLRIGATLSVIGAVVGEFIGADRGLGLSGQRWTRPVSIPHWFSWLYSPWSRWPWVCTAWCCSLKNASCAGSRGRSNLLGGVSLLSLSTHAARQGCPSNQ